MPTDADYTIADLARVTGLNVRTIRYWISQGLVPASGESGPGAHYGQGHLDRLRLIKRLQAEYLPNAEIRRRLAPLSDAEVGALVAEAAPAADPTRPTTSALEYVRGLLSSSSPVPPPAAAKSMPIAAYPATEPAGSTTATQSAPTTSGLRSVAPPSAAAPSVTPSPAGAPVDPSLAGRPRHARIGMDFRAPPPGPGAVDAEALAQAQASTPAMGPVGDVTATADTAQSPQPERSQWERLQLTDNIELHIRRPLSRPEQRRVERLITIARQVLNEGGEG